MKTDCNICALYLFIYQHKVREINSSWAHFKISMFFLGSFQNINVLLGPILKYQCFSWDHFKISMFWIGFCIDFHKFSCISMWLVLSGGWGGVSEARICFVWFNIDHFICLLIGAQQNILYFS